MDWFTNLEGRKHSVLFAVFLLLIAVLAVTALRDPIDYDSFWHLKTGQDWAENSLSPWQDHYSFTFDGAEIRSPAVYFDLGLFKTVDWLGLETGFKLFTFGCMVLVLALVGLTLARARAPTLVYCLVLPMLVALLQMRATTRPELISYVLCVLALILYERAKSALTVRNVLPIAALMLVWANYHSSIFGYVIFFGLFLDYGVKLLSERAPSGQWMRWLAAGGVVVGVGFLNPGFVHPLVSMLVFPAEWKTLIQEYQSPLMYKNVPPVYIFVLMTLMTLVLLVRQRQVGYFVVVCVLAFYAASMARIVTPAGIVILCIFAHALSAAGLQKTVQRAPRRQQKLLGGFALLVFLVPLLNDVVTARAFVRQNMTMAGYFPEGMVQYMKDAGIQGRIFNEYEQGGYLLYNLAPDSKVYIDGRTEILYPVEHYRRFLAAKESVEAMRSEIEEYDINLAILKNSPANARLMAQTGSMQLDYADVRYFLYSRDGAQFPAAGLLWGQPYCWNTRLAEEASAERSNAILTLPPASPLTPFLDMVTNYAKVADQRTFLTEANASADWLDPGKRFLGYQALNKGMYELAGAHFAAVRVKEPKDYLAGALAALRAGDPAQAERILDNALKIRWGNLEFNDLVILEGLLREIQMTRPLEMFDTAYMNELASQVGTHALSRSGQQVSANSFCANQE